MDVFFFFSQNKVVIQVWYDMSKWWLFTLLFFLWLTMLWPWAKHFISTQTQHKHRLHSALALRPTQSELKGGCGRHRLMAYTEDVGRRFSTEPRVQPKRCILMSTPTVPTHLLMSSPLRVFFICASFCHCRFFHWVSHIAPELMFENQFFAQRGGVERVMVIIFTNYYWAMFQEQFEPFHHMCGWKCLAYTSEEENKKKGDIDLGGWGE